MQQMSTLLYFRTSSFLSKSINTLFSSCFLCCSTELHPHLALSHHHCFLFLSSTADSHVHLLSLINDPAKKRARENCDKKSWGSGLLFKRVPLVVTFAESVFVVEQKEMHVGVGLCEEHRKLSDTHAATTVLYKICKRCNLAFFSKGWFTQKWKLTCYINRVADKST